MRKHLLTETILSEPSWRHLCFVDGGDGGDGGGGEGADPDAALIDALDEGTDEGAGEGEGGDEDLAELEIGPDKVKVDKRVREAWDGLHKSTQTKVEQAAAREKAAEERERRAQEFFGLASSFADDLTEIKAIEKQLAPYEKMTQTDWMKWAQEEPEMAQKAVTMVNALKLERGKLSDGLKGKIEQAKAKESQAKTEAAARAEKEIAAQIKDWSPAKRETFQKGVAQHYGITEQEFAFAASHVGSLRLIEDALAFRRIKEKAGAVANTRKATEPTPEPVTRARSNAPTTQLRDTQSMGTWAQGFMAQRGKHLAGKRGG